jgi:Zn-dependent protease with chaperone function
MTEPLALTLDGLLFDGLTLRSRRARLSLAGTRAKLVVAEDELEFAVAELAVSPRVLETPRFVTLPNGWELVCAEQPGLERLPSRSASEGPVAWLERRVGVAVAAVLATLAAVALSYYFGLPRLADAIAARVSPERERILGERTLELFDGRARSPLSALDQATRSRVQQGFEALERDLPPGARARLEFRRAPAIGPNAFALPGGVIVVTDELVRACSVDETVLVLAHELGHVRRRHPLKLVVQRFGLGALGSVFAGDTSSVPFSTAALPLMLARAQYSRAFELEADADGFALAKNAGFSPELFASCLLTLEKRRGASGASGGWSYLSSHPPDAERIERAHRAAAAFVPKAPAAPGE